MKWGSKPHEYLKETYSRQRKQHERRLGAGLCLTYLRKEDRGLCGMSAAGEEESGRRWIQRGNRAGSLKMLEAFIRTSAFTPFMQLESSRSSFSHTLDPSHQAILWLPSPQYSPTQPLLWPNHRELSPQLLQQPLNSLLPRGPQNTSSGDLYKCQSDWFSHCFHNTFLMALLPVRAKTKTLTTASKALLSLVSTCPSLFNHSHALTYLIPTTHHSQFLQKANRAATARLGICCSPGFQNFPKLPSSSRDLLLHLLHTPVDVTSSEMSFPSGLALAAQGPPILPSPQYAVLLLYFTFLHVSLSDVLYIYLFGYLSLHIRI